MAVGTTQCHRFCLSFYSVFLVVFPEAHSRRTSPPVGLTSILHVCFIQVYGFYDRWLSSQRSLSPHSWFTRPLAPTPSQSPSTLLIPPGAILRGGLTVLCSPREGKEDTTGHEVTSSPSVGLPCRSKSARNTSSCKGGGVAGAYIPSTNSANLELSM